VFGRCVIRSPELSVGCGHRQAGVSLPTMEQDFETSVNTIQWVVNAYALTFGVKIVFSRPAGSRRY
jgi:hypothetical protein